MKIGFALITASPYFDNIVEIENKLHESSGFHNKLEKKNNIPHTTIFQGSFADDTDYIQIANELANYYKNICADKTLHFEKVVYVPSGWYFYICKITPELQALHCLTLEKCKEHIILEPDRLSRDMSGLTPEQYAGIRDYGYRYSEKAFYPHITLGRTSLDIEPHILENFQNELQVLPSDIPVERLTVYRMGPDGMHAETLYECQL